VILRQPERGEKARRIPTVTHDTKSEEQIQFWIQKRFFDLISFEMLVLDASLVFAQARDRSAALNWGERFRRNGGVREEDEEHYAPDATESTDEEEFVFPGCE